MESQRKRTDLETVTDLLSLLPAEVEGLLAEHFEARGQRGYRVRQTRAWLYERDAMSFEEMTDLPAGERVALAERFTMTTPAAVRTAESVDGTVKHLWRMADGELVSTLR